LPTLTAVLAIAIGAGAAGVLNMWYDADIDAIMLASDPFGSIRLSVALRRLKACGHGIKSKPIHPKAMPVVRRATAAFRARLIQ
jgi:hypothetical protein